jgi:hypothetical protein
MESGDVPKLMRCAKAAEMSSPGTFCLRYCASEISRYFRMRMFCGRRPIPVNPAGMRVRNSVREPKERMRFRM